MGDTMDIKKLKRWADNNLYRRDGWFDGNRSSEKWYLKNNEGHVYTNLIKFKDDNNLSKISEVAYWLKHDITETPTCKVCQKLLKFYGRKGYSVICNNGSCKAEYHEQVILEKYGTTNYAKTKEFKNTMISKRKDIEKKKKETCIKRYGVDNVMKADSNKKKLEKTMIERFGHKTNLMCLSEASIIKRVETWTSDEYRGKISKKTQLRHDKYTTEEKKEISDKAKKRLITNYGSLYVANLHKNKQKEKTWKAKYGVSNPQQHPEIHEKTQNSRYKFKNVILPSGKIVKVQGYENRVLDHIFENQLYTEEQITLERKKMPTIWYIHHNKKKRYFPDIFIESENKIIEVKSDYTMQASLMMNYAKRDASIEHGYSFEFWIFFN